MHYYNQDIPKYACTNHTVQHLLKTLSYVYGYTKEHIKFFVLTLTVLYQLQITTKLSDLMILHMLKYSYILLPHGMISYAMGKTYIVHFTKHKDKTKA